MSADPTGCVSLEETPAAHIEGKPLTVDKQGARSHQKLNVLGPDLGLPASAQGEGQALLRNPGRCLAGQPPADWYFWERQTQERRQGERLQSWGENRPETHKHPAGTEEAVLRLVYPGDPAVLPSLKQHTGAVHPLYARRGAHRGLEAEVSIFPGLVSSTARDSNPYPCRGLFLSGRWM